MLQAQRPQHAVDFDAEHSCIAARLYWENVAEVVQPAKPRKPRTKSTPANGERWRRVWTEEEQELHLSSEDLATKQSKVAKRNGLRPPTLARRWIDSTGGPRCRKWPYRCVRRIDRQLAVLYEMLEETCVAMSATVADRVLRRIDRLLKQRAELVRPVVIKI